MCVLPGVAQYVFLHGHGGAGEQEDRSYTTLMQELGLFGRWNAMATLSNSGGSSVSGHVYPLTISQLDQVDQLFTSTVVRSAVQVQVETLLGGGGGGGGGSAGASAVLPLACIVYQVAVDSEEGTGSTKSRASGSICRSNPGQVSEPLAVAAAPRSRLGAKPPAQVKVEDQALRSSEEQEQEDKVKNARGSWAAAAADGAALALKWGQSAPRPPSNRG
jgi:hypothetical protein